jgi:hypothetical protein
MARATGAAIPGVDRNSRYLARTSSIGDTQDAKSSHKMSKRHHYNDRL